VKNVIFASAHIESSLAAGIGRYFFGEGDLSQRNMLDDLLVSTDSFTFLAKRKAFLTIVKSQNILDGPEFNAFEKSISKIIRYRNMFTHGMPIYSKSECILHYFEGPNKEKEITDDFLAEVEWDRSGVVPLDGQPRGLCPR